MKPSAMCLLPFLAWALVAAAAAAPSDVAATGVGADEAHRTDPPKLHLGRAGLESLAILAGGGVWYFRNLGFNRQDWDLG